MVVRTAAATVKTAEGTAEATPGAVAVIEMVAETGAATEGPIKMADLRTENSDPATIGVDPEEAVEAPTPLEPVMANLKNNNLMVTEKMVSINKHYEKTRKIWKKPKTNKTKQNKKSTWNITHL